MYSSGLEVCEVFILWDERDLIGNTHSPPRFAHNKYNLPFRRSLRIRLNRIGVPWGIDPVLCDPTSEKNHGTAIFIFPH